MDFRHCMYWLMKINRNLFEPVLFIHSSKDNLSRHSANSSPSLRSLETGGDQLSSLELVSHVETSTSVGASPLIVRKEKEAFQSRTSSGGSLSGKVPPQRPPPPSPSALSRVRLTTISNFA